MSEKTGQHTVAVRLFDSGPRCALNGLPQLTVLDGSGRTIRFRISHAGDLMLRPAQATPFVVERGGSAFVVLNHYRCDLGDVRVAAALRIAGRTVRLPARLLTWCGAGDPGSTLDVSTWVRMPVAALRH